MVQGISVRSMRMVVHKTRGVLQSALRKRFIRATDGPTWDTICSSEAKKTPNHLLVLSPYTTVAKANARLGCAFGSF